MSTLTKTIFAAIAFLAITSSRCTGQDLIIAPPELSQYTLSNIRYETNKFRQSSIAVDFQRTKKGEGSSYLSGKTDSGPIHISGVSINDKQESGKLAFQFIGVAGGRNLEVYLTASGPGGVKYLVSNAVRLGNPGPATKARKLNAEDKAKIAKAIQFKTPPEQLPDDFLPLTSKTPLVPGMPLKAGYYGQWKDAELISVHSNGTVAVKYEGGTTLTRRAREKWLAISPDVIAQGKSNPDQFSPSVQTLPDSTHIIPPGAKPLPDDIELPPGTPLLLDYHDSKWRNVFVISESFGKIKIRYEGYSDTWDKSLDRNKFLIKDSTQKKLGDEEVAAGFAKNLETKKSASSVVKTGERRIKIKSRPINISLPGKTQVVPDDLTIPPGTPLAACWANKWHEITALEENEDGSIFLRWDGFGSEYDMVRDQLVIEDKMVKKLKATKKKPKKTKAASRKKLRTWTDASGDHKIKAKYVSRSAEEVTLETDAGREIILPIDKLSADDQEFLSGIKAKVENPFK